jgi:hypothetical protein
VNRFESFADPIATLFGLLEGTGPSPDDGPDEQVSKD